MCKGKCPGMPLVTADNAEMFKNGVRCPVRCECCVDFRYARFNVVDENTWGVECGGCYGLFLVHRALVGRVLAQLGMVLVPATFVAKELGQDDSEGQ